MKPVDEELELARLLADEPSPLGASISLLRERGPDPSELGSLASRLSLRGIEVTPPARSPSPQAWKKWAVAGGGGVVAGLLWLALRAPEPTREAIDTAERAHALETGRSTRPAPQSPSLVAGQARTATPNAAPTAAVEVPPTSNGAEAPAAPTDDNARPPALTTERKASGDNAASPPRTTDDNPAVTRSTSASALSKPVASSQPDALPADPSVRTEIELLRDARLALRQAPSSALGLVDQHAQLYPQGKLTQERELIAISALVALGRRTAAMSRGSRFEQNFPTSPYRKQVSELLSR